MSMELSYREKMDIAGIEDDVVEAVGRLPQSTTLVWLEQHMPDALEDTPVYIGNDLQAREFIEACRWASLHPSAVHEAGHAVVASYLGHDVFPDSIVLNPAGSGGRFSCYGKHPAIGLAGAVAALFQDFEDLDHRIVYDILREEPEEHMSPTDIEKAGDFTVEDVKLAFEIITTHWDEVYRVARQATDRVATQTENRFVMEKAA
jgi:hypothetical protein